MTAASLGKMPTTSLRRLIPPLSRSSGLRREAHVGQHIGFGIIHQRCKPTDAWPCLIGDLSPLLAGGFGIVLGEGGADPGRDDAPLCLPGMCQALRMKCTRQRCQVALNVRPKTS